MFNRTSKDFLKMRRFKKTNKARFEKTSNCNLCVDEEDI